MGLVWKGGAVGSLCSRTLDSLSGFFLLTLFIYFFFFFLFFIYFFFFLVDFKKENNYGVSSLEGL